MNMEMDLTNGFLSLKLDKATLPENAADVSHDIEFTQEFEILFDTQGDEATLPQQESSLPQAKTDTSLEYTEVPFAAVETDTAVASQATMTAESNVTTPEVMPHAEMPAPVASPPLILPEMAAMPSLAPNAGANNPPAIFLPEVRQAQISATQPGHAQQFPVPPAAEHAQSIAVSREASAFSSLPAPTPPPQNSITPARPDAQSPEQFAVISQWAKPVAPPAQVPAQITPRSKTTPLVKSEAVPVVQKPAQPVLHAVQADVINTPVTLENELPFQVKIERAEAMPALQTQQATRQSPSVAAQISTQIQQQIVKNSQQVLEIRLDPPELGRVTIHLVTHEHSVVAQVTADRHDTLELMRRHSELLANTLEKAGFSQSNLSFQQGTDQKNQQGFSTLRDATATADYSEPTDLITPTVVIDGRLDIRL